MGCKEFDADDGDTGKADDDHDAAADGDARVTIKNKGAP